MRKDICPRCGEEMNGGVCENCGFPINCKLIRPVLGTRLLNVRGKDKIIKKI